MVQGDQSHGMAVLPTLLAGRSTSKGDTLGNEESGRPFLCMFHHFLPSLSILKFLVIRGEALRPYMEEVPRLL